MNKQHPIGVFDSGLGGLTVVKELLRLCPGEQIIYYGDTARVPYGTKSRSSIIQFSVENARMLLKYGVKLIVVACNSSSSYALRTLKGKIDVPVVGVIVPGARKAACMTRNRRVGVIATTATVKSGQYEKHIKRFSPGIQVFSVACPLFVPLVEEGWLNKETTIQVAWEYLKPLKQAKIDTLILGCTHYPLLKEVLRRVMGPGVALVDSGQEVAQEVATLLTMLNGKSSIKTRKHKYLVSDRPQAFQRIARNFLGHDIRIICKS